MSRGFKAVGVAARMAARFNAEAEQAKAESKANPFSKEFDREAGRLKKGDAGYGQAVAGSQTEERAQKAQAWVEKEIEKLIEVIRQHGERVPDPSTSTSEQGAGEVEVTITFGKLFDIYADSEQTDPRRRTHTRPLS